MDVNALRDMVNRMNPSRRDNQYRNLWFKPDESPTTLRILPYPHGAAGIPFFEVYFHYDIGGQKSVVCPKHHDGSVCPVCMLADDFRSRSRGGGRDDPNWRIFTEMQAKPRVYAPVLVRGQEDEGVKLWGFPTSILNYFVESAQDPDWGDFSDPFVGNDVIVQLLMPNTSANPGSFKKPTAKLRPTKSPALTDKKALKELLAGIPNFLELDPCPFPLKTTEELEAAVRRIGKEDTDGIDSDDLPYTETKTTKPIAGATRNDDVSDRLDDLLAD